MIWWLQETGHHRLSFPHRFCPLCECAWFTPSLMDYCVWSQLIAFGGAYRFTVFLAHLWQKTPAILQWSSTILTVTQMDTDSESDTNIWANYNISWIKAIWGCFPLLTMIPVRSQWGRYDLPRNIHRPCSAAGPDKNRPVRWRNSSQSCAEGFLSVRKETIKHSSHQVGQLDIYSFHPVRGKNRFR